MSNVVTYLLNYALDHGIGFTLLNDYSSEWPSLSVPEENMMSLNMKWKNRNEISMIIAHEIGNMLDSDICYLYDQSNIIRIRSENSANFNAIDLLIKYCKENNIEFDNHMTFPTQLNIPIKYETTIRNKMAV